MESIRIPAFAKVNLCLRILGRRPDGYHELRTIFQSISLHDTLVIERTRGARIALSTNAPDVPSGPDNLVWRALEALRGELRVRGGLRVRLTKRIPAGRGLGGGSSDAAAALIGMLRLTGQRLPAERLLAIAARLGADVPYFLGGGRALGIGRGDEIYPLPEIPTATVLVVSPEDIAIPTREAYGWLGAPQLTNSAAAARLGSFCALCWSQQKADFTNDFEKAVFVRYPRLAKIKRNLLQGGAAEAALAGSGSAVFGVFQHPAQARRTAQAFTQHRVFVTRTLTRRRYLRALGWPGLS